MVMRQRWKPQQGESVLTEILRLGGKFSRILDNPPL